MKIVSIILLVPGILKIIEGLAALLTGKVITYGYDNKKYTDESLKEFFRPMGISGLLSGIFFTLFFLLDGNLFPVPAILSAIACAVSAVLFIISLIIFLKAQKKLVKNDSCISGAE